MKQTLLRPLRIVISIIILLLTSFLFVDIREYIPEKYFNYILFAQFFPSFLKFTHSLSWISAGFIFVLILTLLLGRVYCSFLCPLGIFQDIISYISKKLKITKRYKFSKSLKIVRYSLLILAIILLVMDITVVFTILEPYSNFGRIMNGIFRPMVLVANNLVAAVLQKMEIYYLSPEEIKTNMLAVTYPLIVTGVLVWMAGKRGRLFCNAICPVGTLLGLFSKVSVFKLKINEEQCTSCGKCAFSCKAECINIKEKSVDMSRCVGCMNCINSCEAKEIKYRFSFVPLKQETTEHKRKFIKESLGTVLFFIGITNSMKLGASGNSAGAHAHVSSRPTTVSYKKNHAVSPPGSETHEHFNHDCTGCHLCVSACPTKVLQPSGLEYGLKGFLQPHLEFSISYCNYDCTRCGEVCPTGAVLPVSMEEKKTIQIGKVNFIIDNCVVYTENTSCGSCSEHCPTAAVHMAPYKGNLTIPETDTSICIGCGACEYACPVKPYKAIYVDGNTIHLRANKPKEEALEENAIEDFPF